MRISSETSIWVMCSSEVSVREGELGFLLVWLFGLLVTAGAAGAADFSG